MEDRHLLAAELLGDVGAGDLALLVVAADDGIMPQTREHLAILDLLGLSQGLVALTKADLADADRRAEVTAQIRDALADSGLADAPIIPVSSLTGEGVDSLRDALEARLTNLQSVRHLDGQGAPCALLH